MQALLGANGCVTSSLLAEAAQAIGVHAAGFTLLQQPFLDFLESPQVLILQAEQFRSLVSCATRSEPFEYSMKVYSEAEKPGKRD